MTEREAEEFDPTDPADFAEMSKRGAAYREALLSAGGHFGATALPVLKKCDEILTTFLGNGGRLDEIEPDSEEDFASKVQSALIAAHTLTKLDPDQATMIAFIAGCMWGRAEMKWRWEKMAMRGRNDTSMSAERAAKGGEGLKVKAARSRSILRDLAQSSGQWEVLMVGKIDQRKVKTLRELAAAYDQGHPDEPLFSNGLGKSRSDQWFKNLLADWQSRTAVMTQLNQSLKAKKA